jgi:hypothetical protein
MNVKRGLPPFNYVSIVDVPRADFLSNNVRGLINLREIYLNELHKWLNQVPTFFHEVGIDVASPLLRFADSKYLPSYGCPQDFRLIL